MPSHVRLSLVSVSIAVAVALLAGCSRPLAVPNAVNGAGSDLQVMLAEVSAARIESRIRALVAFGTRHTLSDTTSETRGIGAARRWIAAELQTCSQAAGGRLVVEQQSFIEPASRRLPQAAELVNVVATLPGTGAGASRLLVVSGHYDSRNGDVADAQGAAPGANDDASGTAAVMELACVMASRHFDATLVFMAVPGEEQGLLGARHWARQARASGLNVEAMITNDIIGSATGDWGQRDDRRVRLFADGLDPVLRMLAAPPSTAAGASEDPGIAAMRAELLPLVRTGGVEDLPTHQFGRHLKAAAEAAMPGFTVQLIQRRDRYLRGGDHIPFLENGFAAVRFTEPFENFAHQHQNVRTEGGKVYGDLPEFVDFPYVTDVTRVNLAGLATLAWAPAAPKEVKLNASGLSNDSTLAWAVSEDPDVTGYRVVWRSTDSSVWQHHLDVGQVSTATLPVSKDNVLFGVQALSRRGFASLASYPLPKR